MCVDGVNSIGEHCRVTSPIHHHHHYRDPSLTGASCNVQRSTDDHFRSFFPASSHRHQLLQLRSDASLRTSVPGIIGDASIWCVEVGRLFKAPVVCISSPLPSPPHKKSPKFCYKSQHCFEASNLWNTIRRRILCVRFQQVYKNQLRPTVSVSLSDLCVIRPF